MILTEDKAYKTQQLAFPRPPTPEKDHDNNTSNFMAMATPNNTPIFPKKNSISKPWIADTGGVHVVDIRRPKTCPEDICLLIFDDRSIAKTASKEMREYLKGREDCRFMDSEAEEVLETFHRQPLNCFSRKKLGTRV